MKANVWAGSRDEEVELYFCSREDTGESKADDLSEIAKKITEPVGGQKLGTIEIVCSPPCDIAFVLGTTSATEFRSLTRKEKMILAAELREVYYVPKA